MEEDLAAPTMINVGAVEATSQEILQGDHKVNDSGIHDFDVVGDQTPQTQERRSITMTGSIEEQISDLRRVLLGDRDKRGQRLPALHVKRLTRTAKLPTRGSALAIGLDLYADVTGRETGRRISAGDRALISTGIAVAVPPGYYARLAPRSGLALQHGIDVLAGVIDEDYRGEVRVMLLNTDRWGEFYVTDHMRVAQLILERADRLPVVEVDDLDATERGAKGYGSSGY